ncbi:hypothetical protein PILCRDRAFT_3071 [Piloderma croceum F 1598]|uniref:Enoyl reductase (ER) domain-containing protein n=1 Tax=Piloderma croceum (strain F 1598) TaxID=765440 RepID=A0A0C3CGL4_PILCF|nr:hypothetical protein PILCRDRAFT_3071 [Piloderma croceum F 1598]
MTARGVLDAIQTETGSPGPGEVLFKVAYASIILLDVWGMDLECFVTEYPAGIGYGASGTVVEVGPGVESLSVGDRVTASTPEPKWRAVQEYCIVPQSLCAKIPDSLELDAAATIPDNFITACWSIFDGGLNLPVPSTLPALNAPALADTPIVVYGTGTTVGQYTCQVLRLAGYKTVIVTASPMHHEYLRSLGATHTFDYSSPTLADEVIKAAGGKVTLIIDCIATEGTLGDISKFAAPDAAVAVLLDIKEGNSMYVTDLSKTFSELPKDRNPFPESAKIVGVSAFQYFDHELRENLLSKILSSLLSTGMFQPNRVVLMEKGSLMERVKKGLGLLRNNQARGQKVVIKLG